MDQIAGVEDEREGALSPVELDAVAEAVSEAMGLGESLETPPDPDEPKDVAEARRQRLAGMRALYGESFPLAMETGQEIAGEHWVAWVRDLWERHEKARQRRMVLVQKLRLFREGVQWITPMGGRWEEPPKPKHAVRVVHNLFGPALDQRANLLSEQRPGFRTKPKTQNPDSLKRAEAAQLALEYQYDQQQMWELIREAAYWNGTDGVAAWLVYWDADAGPWHKEFQYAVDPETGEESEEPVRDPETGEPVVLSEYPMGDIRTRTYRTEQVAVSANATASQRPWYVVLREPIPQAEAVAFHGDAVAGESGAGGRDAADFFAPVGSVSGWQGADEERFEGQDLVWRYMAFCEPSEYLPKGLTVIVVGEKCVHVGELDIGRVPVVRVPDGSTDPSWFPRPESRHWTDHQMRINAVLSKWVESVAHNAGGRLAYRAQAVNLHELVGGQFTGIEVRSAGSIRDAIEPIPAFSLATDAKELLSLAIRAFEELSGFHSASRGQASSGASGRAILAAREGLERIYAPSVNAMARAMTDWARLCLEWMRWGYDLPRKVQLVGAGRMDLALELSKDEIDPETLVEIDPETLMPMPNAYKQFLLDQSLEKKIIDVKEYRQRMPFSFIGNMDRPADHHTARAKRIAAQIIQGTPAEALPPIRWQDNEAVHQDVLESEVLLRDDLDPAIIEVANARWMALAQQAMMKQGGQPAAPAPGGELQAGGSGSPFKPGPEKQPLLGMLPGMAAAPQDVEQGLQGEQMAGALFDRTRVV